VKNLQKVISRIESELDEKDEVREVALKSTRAVVRLAGSILRGLHRGERKDQMLDELRDEASMLTNLLLDHPELANTGYVQTAFQEYSEAMIVISLLQKNDIPSPDDLRVSSVAFLLGLADTVGELRRFCLDELKLGRVEKANHYLEQMEDIYSAIARFDLPDAIAPIRHKQDVARSLIEKTQGEVALATTSQNLQKKLEQVMKRSGLRGTS
jgi:translin